MVGLSTQEEAMDLARLCSHKYPSVGRAGSVLLPFTKRVGRTWLIEYIGKFTRCMSCITCCTPPALGSPIPIVEEINFMVNICPVSSTIMLFHIGDQFVFLLYSTLVAWLSSGIMHLLYKGLWEDYNLLYLLTSDSPYRN